MKRPSVKACGVITSLTTFVVVIVSVIIWTPTRIEIKQVSDAEIKQVSDAIEEYRNALQTCKESKDQDTAEILNRESMTANFMYFIIKPDLTGKQLIDLGVPLALLNDSAIDSVRAIKPQTGYTQHYRHSIIRRKVLWELDAIVGRQAAVKLLIKELASADDFRAQFVGMTAKEQHEFLSKPLAEKNTEANL